MQQSDASFAPALAQVRAQLDNLAHSTPAARQALRARLHILLTAGAPSVRALAAEGLGRVGDSRAVAPLLVALHDPHPLVQWHAAHALRALHVHALVPPTLLHFDDGPAFQAWLNGLVGGVVAALYDSVASNRADAVRTLDVLALPATIPALVRVLGDPAPLVSAAAHSALRRLIGLDPTQLSRAAPALYDALHAPDPVVRQTVATLLGSLGLRVAAAWLHPLLHDVASDVRAAAATALGEIGAPAAVRPLQAALLDDAPAVRRAAAHALGELADPGSAPALAQAATDDQLTVRRAAVAALATLGHRAGADALLAAARSDDAVLRYHAALGLGRLRDPRARRALAALRHDHRAVAQSTVAHAARAAQRATAR